MKLANHFYAAMHAPVGLKKINRGRNTYCQENPDQLIN